MAEPVAYAPDGTPIAGDKLHEAISSGAARFRTGQTVHFEDKATGTQYDVPGEQAWSEIQRGNLPITGEEFERRQDIARRAASPVEAAKTFGAGTARALTFGASDVALQSLDPGYAEAERRRE